MNKDMYLISAVEMATIAAYKFIGRKDKNAVDFAAVEAMTIMLNSAPIKCRIIIGEGELDQAPMLFVNQQLGKGKTLIYDLAVDPVRVLILLPINIAGSIACLAAAPNTILKLPEMYMEKLFVGPQLQAVINNEDDFITNIKAMQKMKKHTDLIGIILDKLRHQKIIEKLHDLGIIVWLIGDVLAAIDVINKEVDFVYGIGAAPEGALALSAGGNIKTKLISYQTIWPDNENTNVRVNIEDAAINKYKLSYHQYYFAKDLVKDENIRFIATGLTAGGSLSAIKYYYGTYYVNTFFVSHGVVRNMKVTYSVDQLNKLLPSVAKIMKYITSILSMLKEKFMNDTNYLSAITIVESQRLKLRPITLNDGQALFNYAKNAKMTKYVPWTAHKNINDSINFINSLLKEYQQRTSLMWAVQLKDDKSNTIIGTCGFIRYFAHTKCLEIGYAFNPKVWGQGYAKEALLAVIKYGFENTDTIRIEGSCVKENIASAQTMLSAGMQFEGISRSNFIKDGQVSDCKIFSIIRSEYFKTSKK